MGDRYTMGSCHHLAVALHRLTGWDLALVAGPHHGRDAVLHVFCLAPDGTAWDARGDHPVDDLVEEQAAATGRDAWCVRLDGEPAVWALAAGGLLNPIHPTHVLDAIEAAEAVVEDAAPLVSDGWAPRDKGAVEDARAGRRTMPEVGRAAAMDPSPSPAP